MCTHQTAYRRQQYQYLSASCVAFTKSVSPLLGSPWTGCGLNCSCCCCFHTYMSPHTVYYLLHISEIMPHMFWDFECFSQSYIFEIHLNFYMELYPLNLLYDILYFSYNTIFYCWAFMFFSIFVFVFFFHWEHCFSEHPCITSWVELMGGKVYVSSTFQGVYYQIIFQSNWIHFCSN